MKLLFNITVEIFGSIENNLYLCTAICYNIVSQVKKYRKS